MGRSVADVLIRDPYSQPLASLLSTPAEGLTSPLRGHARTESVRLYTPLITGTIGRLTHETRGLGDEEE
jgi:hypothetical protein